MAGETGSAAAAGACGIALQRNYVEQQCDGNRQRNWSGSGRNSGGDYRQRGSVCCSGSVRAAHAGLLCADGIPKQTGHNPRGGEGQCAGPAGRRAVRVEQQTDSARDDARHVRRAVWRGYGAAADLCGGYFACGSTRHGLVARRTLHRRCGDGCNISTPAQDHRCRARAALRGGGVWSRNGGVWNFTVFLVFVCDAAGNRGTR